MKFFQNKGDRQALRLQFHGFHLCDWDYCKNRRHILYYYHQRMVCKKHLPKMAIIVSNKNWIKYKLEKIKD